MLALRTMRILAAKMLSLSCRLGVPFLRFLQEPALSVVEGIVHPLSQLCQQIESLCHPPRPIPKLGTNPPGGPLKPSFGLSGALRKCNLTSCPGDFSASRGLAHPSWFWPLCPNTKPRVPRSSRTLRRAGVGILAQRNGQEVGSRVSLPALEKAKDGAPEIQVV